MASTEGQQHPLGIYFQIWILLFVLSAASYAWSTTWRFKATCVGP